MNQLATITEKTRERVEERKKRIGLAELERQVEEMGPYAGPSFFEALCKEEMAMICEVKKASPSKGLISPDFPYLEIARAYENGGAAAISCLTEPYFFLGEDRYLQEIVQTVSLPVLRKDFVIDPYMIYEARRMGAAAVLLICAILNDQELASCLRLVHSLGLDALVETHSEEEIHRAVQAGARIIGINNRDLTSFQVDLETSERLCRRIPKGTIWISESGIRSHEDVRRCQEWGASGILVGETLMRDQDPAGAIRRLQYGEG